MDISNPLYVRPWKPKRGGGNSVLTPDAPGSVLPLGMGGNVMATEDAERYAALWNAFLGVETEKLKYLHRLVHFRDLLEELR